MMPTQTETEILNRDAARFGAVIDQPDDPNLAADDPTLLDALSLGVEDIGMGV